MFQFQFRLFPLIVLQKQSPSCIVLIFCSFGSNQQLWFKGREEGERGSPSSICKWPYRGKIPSTRGLATKRGAEQLVCMSRFATQMTIWRANPLSDAGQLTTPREKSLNGNVALELAVPLPRRRSTKMGQLIEMNPFSICKWRYRGKIP